MRRVGSAVLPAVLGALLVAGCGSPAGDLLPAAPVVTGAPALGEPVEIGIPRIGVSSSLVGLGLAADQTVEVPPVETPMQAGWFTGGPAPGQVGPAVVLGHVDGGGQAGVFHRLHELRPGDEIVIGLTGATARFVVRGVDQVPKSQFPTEAVYGDTAVPELRLITCGGEFDRTARSYRDNVIVYAERA